MRARASWKVFRLFMTNERMPAGGAANPAFGYHSCSKRCAQNTVMNFEVLDGLDWMKPESMGGEPEPITEYNP